MWLDSLLAEYCPDFFLSFLKISSTSGVWLITGVYSLLEVDLLRMNYQGLVTLGIEGVSKYSDIIIPTEYDQDDLQLVVEEACELLPGLH